jgi:hypothetical protein
MLNIYNDKLNLLLFQNNCLILHPKITMFIKNITRIVAKIIKSFFPSNLLFNIFYIFIETMKHIYGVCYEIYIFIY